MTSLLTRSPLQHMPMNRAAHPTTTAPSRRRSARHLDDDHDETAGPPAKKVKADTANKKDMGGAGKANGAGTRKGRKGMYSQVYAHAISRADAKRCSI